MVSGGVSFDNMGEWFKNGCDVVSIGSAIVNLKDPEVVKEKTREYINKVKEFRN